jgi:hypothetical protein
MTTTPNFDDLTPPMPPHAPLNVQRWIIEAARWPARSGRSPSRIGRRLRRMQTTGSTFKSSTTAAHGDGMDGIALPLKAAPGSTPPAGSPGSPRCRSRRWHCWTKTYPTHSSCLRLALT